MTKKKREDHEDGSDDVAEAKAAKENEDALKAANDEADKVSVEMTPKQRDKVVEILAEEEKKKDEKAAFAIVNLRFAHRRNGNPYGPGVVRCDAGLAASLVAADHKAFERRLKDSMGADHSIKILGHGKATIITKRDGEA